MQRTTYLYQLYLDVNDDISYQKLVQYSRYVHRHNIRWRLFFDSKEVIVPSLAPNNIDYLYEKALEQELELNFISSNLHEEPVNVLLTQLQDLIKFFSEQLNWKIDGSFIWKTNHMYAGGFVVIKENEINGVYTTEGGVLTNIEE